MGNDTEEKELNLDIVIAEFNYIAETAFQANEDRARVSQIFFVTFGTFIAAIFSTQFDNIDLNQIYSGFAIVFGILALLGVLTLLQLARLRRSWIESAKAMDQIKEQACIYYPEFEAFFRWNMKALPPIFNPKSISFYLAFMVAIQSGLAVGSGLSFWALALSQRVYWGLSICGGVFSSFLFIYLFYIYQLHILE